MDGALRDVIAILLSGGGIDQQIRKRAKGLTIFRRRFGICLDIRRRDSFHLQLFCVFRIGTLFIAVQGIGNGRIYLFPVLQIVPTQPGFCHGDGTPVDIPAERIGQRTAHGFLRIQLIRDRVRHSLVDGVNVSAPFGVKLGKAWSRRRIEPGKPFPFLREGIEIPSAFTRGKRLTGDEFNGFVVNQPFNFFRRFVQQIHRRQRTVQLDGGRGIVLQVDLIPLKALPGLFAADGDAGGQGVGELVIGLEIGFFEAVAGLTRLNIVFGRLNIGSVDGFALIVHGLLKPIGILPSLLVIQGQIRYLGSPVVGVIHIPDGIAAVGERLIRSKFLHGSIRAAPRVRL